MTVVLVFKECYCSRKFVKGKIDVNAAEAIAVQSPQCSV